MSRTAVGSIRKACRNKLCIYKVGWAVGCMLKTPSEESRKKTDTQTGRREAAVLRKKALQQAVEVFCQPLALGNKACYGCEYSRHYPSPVVLRSSECCSSAEDALLLDVK
jgi:hypothetical protein